MSGADAAPVGAVRRSLRAVSLGLAMLVPVACVGSTEAAARHHAASRGQPSARARVAAGARLLDVRTPEEFDAGHIEGAVNLPIDVLPGRIGELGPPSTPIVVYCRSGRRSADAAVRLRAAGFTDVLDLGPMTAW